jgi:HNH endonuclease
MSATSVVSGDSPLEREAALSWFARSTQHNRAWSFLSLERTARLGIGEIAYPDELGVRYVYDNHVSHHAEVQVGDLALIRDEKVVLGAGRIDDIQVEPGYKVRQRCPTCHSTDYKLRVKVRPSFRCSSCFAEFDETDKSEIIIIRRYTANYASTWQPADSMFPVRALGPMYLSRAAQHSIRGLNLGLLRPLLLARLAAVDFWWDCGNDERPDPSGGYKTSLGKTRLGQQRFREEMLGRFGNNCAFTGAQPPESLEAAHLYGFSKSPRHDLRGGLLLRRDLHALFDRGAITVDPKSWHIDIDRRLDCYPEILALKGKLLRVSTHLRPRESYLKEHAAWARSTWTNS